MGNESSSLEFDMDFFNKNATPVNLSGRGASGFVYGPIRRKDKQLAIKQVMFADDKSADEIRKDIEEKQQIWNSLEHEHLMRILSVNLSQLPKVMYIVMEFAAGGSLNCTLRALGSKNKLQIDVVTDWTKQIAEGMIYLHKRNIIHRDLKPSNILLSEPFNFRNPPETMILKITDFDDVKKHHHTTTMSFVGTITYMAPEVLQHQRFSKASDVWSFGLLVWEMLTGDIPNKGLQPSEIIVNFLGGKLDDMSIEPSFPEEYQYILKQCWKSEREERFSFQQILEVLQQIEIRGLTSLHQEVFVTREQHPVIEVYDSTTFIFKRRMAVQGMTLPSNVVSCSTKNCLYTADSKYQKDHPAILKIDPINGNLIRTWKISWHESQLSVANDSNLIVSSYIGASLYEYTADGELFRTINLCCDFDGKTSRNIAARHAVKLGSGLFVVCRMHPNVIYLLSTSKTCIGSSLGRIDVVEILKEFSELPGELHNTFRWLDYLSVDKGGTILVSDKFNHRAVLLSSNLDKARILVSEEYGMKSSYRTCFDESSGKWLLTDGRRIMTCRVEDENIESKIYELISLEDNQD